MADVKDNDNGPDGEKISPDSTFDRQAYLKEVRSTLLKNMGLPDHTKPDKVMQLLAIQEKMNEIKNK